MTVNCPNLVRIQNKLHYLKYDGANYCRSNIKLCNISVDIKQKIGKELQSVVPVVIL